VSHIWSDGFTAYNLLSDFDQLYTREGVNNNLRVVLAGGPSENGSVRLGGVDQSNSGFYRDLGTAITIGYIGFWFKFNDFDTNDGLDDMIFKLSAGVTARMSMRLSDDGSIQIRSRTTSAEYFDSADITETLDGLQHFLFRGTEYKIELKIEGVNNFGSLELRVNDEVWAILDTLDFDGTYDRISFQTGEVGEGADFEISDLYVMDDQGTIAANATFLGSRWAVELLRPDAESAQIAFTPESGVDNSAMVDDAPRNNQDTDWNDSTGDAQIDRFTSTDTLNGALIHNVSVVNVARHTGTAQNFRAVIFEGATSGNGGDAALTASFEIFMEDYEINPDTTDPWTVTEVEAAEFGYESRA
jgi:hypothetical protein